MLFISGKRFAGVFLFLIHQLFIVSIDGHVLGNLTRDRQTKPKQRNSPDSTLDVHEENMTVTPINKSNNFATYLSSFSVVLGLGAFGFQGILLGPLLVCLALLLYKAFLLYNYGIDSHHSKCNYKSQKVHMMKTPEQKRKRSSILADACYGIVQAINLKMDS